MNPLAWLNGFLEAGSTYSTHYTNYWKSQAYDAGRRFGIRLRGMNLRGPR